MSNTKRILKNTIVLYVRMVIVMLITLYTSRIVLQALGVDDFGLYHVVGGVVGLLTFFNGAMAKSTQRFLNVAMVKSEEELSGIFASSITIHLLLALVFLLLGETIGLWFLNEKINIPESRELAANIVYQASLVSFCISIITVPYSAAVVAYERMTFLAVVSIIDALLKLSIAFFILNSTDDRLILYGILLMGIQVINFILYSFYIRKRYSILKFRLSFNKENFKQIFSFVSWTLVGQSSIVACNQGNVILVNMFHSLVANAAMSVGSQINAAISNLTTNFQTAFNPQITKSYATGDFNYLRTLVLSTSKISFCIMYAVALPLALNIDWALDLWLDEVPVMSNKFAILFMLNGIINAISMPYNFVTLSSGNIRKFQIFTAVFFLLDIPVVFLLYKLGLPPISVMYVKIGVITAVLFVRVYFASLVVNTITFMLVIKKVLFPIVFLMLASFLLTILMRDVFHFSDIICTLIIEGVIVAMMWFVCFSINERVALVNMIKMLKKNK